MYNYSFIIPHKNSPSFLERCVDSIPERDDVQVIVVDDNSDEEKKPTLKDHRNLQIISLDEKHSKGAGRARNVGLEYAEGKWLLFADCDDYYVDNFLDVLDNYLDSANDVVYFNFHYRDGNTGKELPSLNSQRYFDEYNDSLGAIESIKFLHKAPWAKMVRKDYVKEHSIYFEEVPNGNDILFSMMVGYYTDNCIVEKKKLYIYLLNSNSILTSKETVGGAVCRIIHTIKLNSVYKYLGHPEWEQPVLLRIMKSMVVLKLPLLVALIKNTRKIYKERNEWVNLLEQSK